VRPVKGFIGRRCDPCINRRQLGGMPTLAYLDALTSRCRPPSFLWYHTSPCHKLWYRRRKLRGRAKKRCSQCSRSPRGLRRTTALLTMPSCGRKSLDLHRQRPTTAGAAGRQNSGHSGRATLDEPGGYELAVPVARARPRAEGDNLTSTDRGSSLTLWGYICYNTD
jgi:hypothetical protein